MKPAFAGFFYGGYMAIDQAILEELKILALFPQDSLREGIKVHSNASKDSIAATQRLYEKGLVTQPDGGYLTDLGVEMSIHTHHLISGLNT